MAETKEIMRKPEKVEFLVWISVVWKLFWNLNWLAKYSWCTLHHSTHTHKRYQASAFHEFNHLMATLPLPTCKSMYYYKFNKWHSRHISKCERKRKEDRERESAIVNYIMNLNDDDIHDNPNQFRIHLIIIWVEIHLWVEIKKNKSMIYWIKCSSRSSECDSDSDGKGLMHKRHYVLCVEMRDCCMNIICIQMRTVRKRNRKKVLTFRLSFRRKQENKKQNQFEWHRQCWWWWSRVNLNGVWTSE